MESILKRLMNTTTLWLMRIFVTYDLIILVNEVIGLYIVKLVQ